MAIKSGGAGPYAPAPAITNTLDSVRQRGFPSAPFTADVLVKIGVSETLTPRTLAALKLLDLVDEDGRPTQTFEDLRKAPEDDYKQRVEDMVRAAYAEVFEFKDPSDPNLRDAFRDYLPHGQQDRMVNLFLGLCEYAGIIESAPKKSRRSPRSKGAGAANQGARSGKVQAQRGAAKRGGENQPDGSKGGTGGDASKPVRQTALDRYVDVLLKRLDQEWSPDLLDRIERVLGVQDPQASASASGRGQNDNGGGESSR